MVADNKGGDECELKLRVDGHPHALLFKDRERTALYAWVCVQCGFTELYAEDPKILQRAWMLARNQPD